MAKRLLALVVAAALLGGAFWWRSRDAGDPGTSVSAGEPLRLVCSGELEDACQALAAASGGRLTVVVEPAGITAGRWQKATDGALDADGWLVDAAWPEIVDDARVRGGLAPVLEPGPVLARTPLVMAAWAERAELLAAACGGELTWRCVGEHAGEAWTALGGQPTWGPVKPGHEPPDTSAVGVDVVGQATASYFGTTDIAAADLDDDGFRVWFRRLENAVPTFRPSAGTPVEQMVLVGPASYDVVGATEAQAGPLLERSAARRGSLRILYPAPMATSDVLLARAAGTDPGRAAALAELVGGEAGARALAGAGYRVDGQPLAAGVPADPPLPSGNGLPSPGVLEALRQRWVEVKK